MAKKKLSTKDILKAQAEYYEVVSKNMAAINWKQYKPEEIPLILAKFIENVFNRFAYMVTGLLEAELDKDKKVVN